jgi:hypothetical protein
MTTRTIRRFEVHVVSTRESMATPSLPGERIQSSGGGIDAALGRSVTAFQNECWLGYSGPRRRDDRGASRFGA